MYFRKSNLCSHKLDVHEANVTISQFHRIGICFFGCWFANGWNLCSRSVGCGDGKFAFFEEHPFKQREITVEKKGSMIKYREVEYTVTSKAPTPTPNRKDTVTEKLMDSLMWDTL